MSASSAACALTRGHDAWTAIAVSACVGIILLGLGTLAGLLIGRQRVQKLESKSLDNKLQKLERCLATDGPSGRLLHPFVVIRAQDFLSMGKIVKYEDLRRAGLHVVLDTMNALKEFERKERILFLSHQWTSFVEPDHTGQHYVTMIAALQRVQTANKWPLERVFIWLDYSCVPQLHRPTQELAILSISIYSSRAHAFVAVVPTTKHKETCEPCTAESYQYRLWTRAECFTHLLTNGPDSMWIATEPNPSRVIPMPREWLRGSALQIFQGESTCCQRGHVGVERCDRELLVEPVLGMYGRLYARTKVARERHGTRLYSVRRRSSMTDGGLESKSLFELNVWKKQPSASDQPIQANDSELETFALLESLEALIFPSSFQYQCSTNEGGADGDETRELFGTLVPLMKLIIDDDRSLQRRLNLQQSRLLARRNNFEKTLHNKPSQRVKARRFSLSRLITGDVAEQNQSGFQLTEENLRLSEQTAQLGEGSMYPEALALRNSMAVRNGARCGTAQAMTRASQCTTIRAEESSCATCTHIAFAFAGRGGASSAHGGGNIQCGACAGVCEDAMGCTPDPGASALDGAQRRQPSMKRQQSNVSISEHLEVVDSKNVVERRRRGSASHEGIFEKHGRRLSLNQSKLQQTSNERNERAAKLAHRWSFPCHYELARAGHDAHFASAQMAVTATSDETVKVGIGLDDRLTLAASITLARRRAAWLDGEKEFTANSSRHLSYSHRARNSARGGTTWHGRRLSRWLQDHTSGFRGRACSLNSRHSQSTQDLSEESKLARQDKWRETAKRAEQARGAFLSEFSSKLSLNMPKPNLRTSILSRPTAEGGRPFAMGALRRSSCRSSTRSRTGSVESISDDQMKRLSASQPTAVQRSIVRKPASLAPGEAPATNGRHHANVV